MAAAAAAVPRTWAGLRRRRGASLRPCSSEVSHLYLNQDEEATMTANKILRFQLLKHASKARHQCMPCHPSIPQCSESSCPDVSTFAAGGTHVPAVQQLVELATGIASDAGLDPELCVAIGAGIQVSQA